MKQLLILILSFGLFFTAFAGCGACGGNHDHSHYESHAHSHDEKSAKSSCCYKKGDKKLKEKCCKKAEKRSCESCTSTCSSK